MLESRLSKVSPASFRTWVLWRSLLWWMVFEPTTLLLPIQSTVAAALIVVGVVIIAVVVVVDFAGPRCAERARDGRWRPTKLWRRRPHLRLRPRPPSLHSLRRHDPAPPSCVHLPPGQFQPPFCLRKEARSFVGFASLPCAVRRVDCVAV